MTFSCCTIRDICERAMERCLCMVKVLDGRSGNASEYVYLFLKDWPYESWSQYLASLSTTILYMQYPLPRFEHLAALRQAWQLLKQHKALYRYPLIITILTLGSLGVYVLLGSRFIFFSGVLSSAGRRDVEWDLDLPLPYAGGEVLRWRSLSHTYSCSPPEALHWLCPSGGTLWLGGWCGLSALLRARLLLPEPLLLSTYALPRW